MGHIHLATLPSTKPWREVVRAARRAMLRSDDVIAASAIAAEQEPRRRRARPGARRGRAPAGDGPPGGPRRRLRRAAGGDGRRGARPPMLGDLAVGMHSRSSESRTVGARTDFSEIARRALLGTLSITMADDALPGLFEAEADDVRAAVARLGRPEDVLAGRARLLRPADRPTRSATGSIARSRPRSGRARRIECMAARDAFDRALDQYCIEATRIIREFAGDWYSKTLYREGTITSERAAAFTAVVLRKIDDGAASKARRRCLGSSSTTRCPRAADDLADQGQRGARRRSAARCPCPEATSSTSCHPRTLDLLLDRRVGLRGRLPDKPRRSGSRRPWRRLVPGAPVRHPCPRSDRSGGCRSTALSRDAQTFSPAIISTSSSSNASAVHRDAAGAAARTRRPHADEVILFSGGLELPDRGVRDAEHPNRSKTVLLVTHRSATKTAKVQTALARSCRSGSRNGSLGAGAGHLVGVKAARRPSARDPFSMPHLAMRRHRWSASPASSFFENGIVSVNLPIDRQVVGTMATRTTHPLFLDRLRRLLSAVCATGRVDQQSISAG